MSHLTTVIAKLGSRATLHEVDGAIHAFHVPTMAVPPESCLTTRAPRSGRRDADVLAALLNRTSAWMQGRLG